MSVRTGFVLLFVLAPLLTHAQFDRRIKSNDNVLGKVSVVKTKKIRGVGPFYPTGGMIGSSKVNMDDYKTPRNLVIQQIRFFDFQNAQGIYERYLHGELSKEKALRYFVSNMIDTLNLSRTNFNHQLALLYGMDSANNYVIIPDRNFNKSFLDDSVHVYPSFGDADKEVVANNALAPLNFKYEFYDRDKVVPASSWLKISPYRGHLLISGISHIDSVLFLSIGYVESRESIFTFHGKRYKAAISNYPGTTVYSNKNEIKFIFAPEGLPYQTQLSGSIPYRLKDIVTLDNYQLRLDSIDFNGANFYFTDLGYQKFPEGFSVGLYPPPVLATTLQRNVFSLRDYRKKYLLLDFWGTWCGPCIDAMPKVKEIYERYPKDKLSVVGVAYDNTREGVHEFITKNEIPWQQVFQDRKDKTDADMILKLRVNEFPTVMLIDPNGKIIMRDNSIEKVEEKLSELLK